MTQEDRELLLKDLCGRLPYGVIVDYKENEFEIPHWRITTIYPETLDGWIGYNKRVGAGSESGSRPFKIGDVKPYVRPMSSMTEEEKREIYDWLVENDVDWFDFSKLRLDEVLISFDSSWLLVNWLIEHHFDYRGLIERGLAIEVTEKNNPYKE
jgi:hypothetical protein